MKKTRRSKYVYDFSVDSNNIRVDDILDFHIYVMKKRNMK